MTSSSDRQPRRWTHAEDQILREQVDIQLAQGGGRDWCQVALALPGRTNKDCRKRWHNSVAEGLKKGQWSKSEDQLLTHGVHRYGYQWTKVATCVGSRSADQCAKRWQQSLDPRLDRSEWREAEDIALLAAVERLGRHWKDIQGQYLPHRSKNCVKNRYSVLARRNAIQFVPSEDGLESSSSDPGTPLQVDLALNLNSTCFIPSATQSQYQQSPVPQHNNNIEPSWYWSGDGEQGVSSLGVQYDPFDTSSWPASCSVIPTQTLPSNQDQWSALQPTMDMHHPGHYPRLTNALMGGHARPMHQQALSSSIMPYVISDTVSSHSRAPFESSPRIYAPRGGYSRQYGLG